MIELELYISLKIIKNPVFMVRAAGLEPARAQGPTDFKSGMSTNSITPAAINDLACSIRDDNVSQQQVTEAARLGLGPRRAALGYYKRTSPQQTLWMSYR